MIERDEAATATKTCGGCGFIRQTQAAGFTLEEIGGLLALDATEDRARARELAGTRIAALDAKISVMQAGRDALAGPADGCDAELTRPCPIIAVFER